MFLIKIFHFLKGYVILSLSGHNKEEFLNEILKKGICPQNMDFREDKIFLEIGPWDFFEIPKAKNGTRVHIEEKRGLIFLWERLKRRKLFFIGAAVFFLAFTIGSQFIWTVEYDCSEDCDRAGLAQAAELAGVKSGVLKRSMKSGLEMKNIILNNTDGISWCWVYIKGTRAVVKARSVIPPPELYDPSLPSDIIAMRDGIIKRVITDKGRCMVKPNQAVAPGDVIISGTFDFEEQRGYQVHSLGKVEAYTNHSRTGVYKQFYCYKTYTGRVRRFLTLRIYKWEIPLYFKGKVNFDSFDSMEKDYELRLGGSYLGIGLKTLECREFYETKEPLSYDAAVEFAKNDLESKIAKELLPPAQLVDKNVSAVQIDEETISVTVEMQFIEEIGAQKQIKEVENIEPKTDRLAWGD